MKSLFIPVHSFVDVITNSSSEVFVSADKNTIKAVKEIINNLLKGAGSDKTSDDLFDIVISIEVDNPIPYKDRKPGDPYNLMVPVDSELGKEAYEERERRIADGEGGTDTGVLVTPKPGTNEHFIAAAKILSNLSGLFETNAYYNG